MKKSSLIARIRLALLPVALCLMLAFGGAVVPTAPAYAQKSTFAIDLFPPNLLKLLEDTEGFADVLEMLKTIFEVGNKILGAITDGFEAIFGAMDDEIEALLAAKMVGAKAEQEAIEYAINSDANDKYMAATIPYMMEHTPPRNAQLCRQTVIHQGAAKGGELIDLSAHIAVDAYLSFMRGVGKDGSGPQGIMAVSELRCLNKYGNPIDGYPPECMDLSTTVGEFKRTFIDADLLASTMDGAVTLEIPNMEQASEKTAEGQSMAVVVAVPQNNEQKMYLAALNYCLQMAGPRPTPPAGNSSQSNHNIQMTQQFKSIAAASSALVHQCGRVLGYYARPNAQMKDKVEDGNKMCRSFIGKAGQTNYLDEETLKKKFGDCKLGLSKYQREFLEKLGCKSAQYFMLSAHSGALTPEMMDQAVACGAGWNMWEANTTTLQGSLVDIAAQHLKNRKRFNELDAAMRGARRK